MQENRYENGFAGSWWRYPPRANALIAGLIAGAGFALAHQGLIADSVENVFYWVAIPLGVWHWTRDGTEIRRSPRCAGIWPSHQAPKAACDGIPDFIHSGN